MSIPIDFAATCHRSLYGTSKIISGVPGTVSQVLCQDLLPRAGRNPSRHSQARRARCPGPCRRQLRRRRRATKSTGYPLTPPPNCHRFRQGHAGRNLVPGRPVRRCRTGCLRQLPVGGGKVELLEKAGQIHIQRPVDDNAERAIGVVLTNQGNGAIEIGIGHSWHGDQQMIAEGALIFHPHSIGSWHFSHNPVGQSPWFAVPHNVIAWRAASSCWRSPARLSG